MLIKNHSNITIFKDIQNYVAEKKKLYEKLQTFIDNDNLAQINFRKLNENNK